MRMEAVFDFLRAALPWVVLGLLLAVYFARSAGKQQKEGCSTDYAAEGMIVGMGLGVCLFSALGQNIGLGVSIGMLIGLAVGCSIRKKKQKDGKA